MQCCKCGCMRNLILRLIRENIPTPPTPVTSITGLQAQSKHSTVVTIAVNDYIPFDTEIFNNSDVVLNDSAFEIKTSGVYKIDFAVNTGSTGGNTVRLVLTVNDVDTSQITYLTDGSGVIAGTNLIELKAGDKLSIRNISNYPITLGNVETQSNIVITKL